MAVGTVAAGDAVGQGVEFGDQLVVGDRVPRRAVWRDDADLMDVAVAGGHGEVGAEPFGQRGVGQRLVQVHIGDVDQRPDVVGVQARRGELLGQGVAVEQRGRGRVADVHLGADGGQWPLGLPPAVLVHGLADGDVDLRDILGDNRLP